MQENSQRLSTLSNQPLITILRKASSINQPDSPPKHILPHRILLNIVPCVWFWIWLIWLLRRMWWGRVCLGGWKFITNQRWKDKLPHRNTQLHSPGHDNVTSPGNERSARREASTKIPTIQPWANSAFTLISFTPFLLFHVHSTSPPKFHSCHCPNVILFHVHGISQ